MLNNWLIFVYTNDFHCFYVVYFEIIQPQNIRPNNIHVQKTSQQSHTTQIILLLILSILLNWALNNPAQELCFQSWLNLYIKINHYWHTTKNSSLVSRPFPSLSNILKAISRPLFDSEQRQRNKRYSKKKKKKMKQVVLLIKSLLGRSSYTLF